MHWMMNASKEQLADVIQAVKKINNNYERMKDVTIVKKLMNDEVNLLNVFKHLDKQFPEICIAVVKQRSYALECIEKQTPELCLVAVQQNGLALKYVKEQTPEICMAAAQENGYALQHVKKQTPEICLAAVQQDGSALKYVKEQTLETCMAAAQGNDTVFDLIDKTKFRVEIEITKIT
jgi:predicted unusual protein kinase regulating ubiquinone biosynthesis (AarF/ABC1/UbiB family)